MRRWCINNGEWALLGDPTRYYRANKHAVCPPLSPLDTVGITHPPLLCICSIRCSTVSVRPLCLPSRGSLLTPRLYPISSRPLSLALSLSLIGEHNRRRRHSILVRQKETQSILRPHYLIQILLVILTRKPKIINEETLYYLNKMKVCQHFRDIFIYSRIARCFGILRN